MPWSRIASGGEDRVIVRQAAAFRALGKPILEAFHHEPEDDLGGNGTAAQYVDVARSSTELGATSPAYRCGSST